MNELRIVVMRSEELKGYPFTAALVGSRWRGYGTSVEAAVADLFTARGPHELALAFEREQAAEAAEIERRQ